MRWVQGVGGFVMQPPLRGGAGAVGGVVGGEAAASTAHAGDEFGSGPVGRGDDGGWGGGAGGGDEGEGVAGAVEGLEDVGEALGVCGGLEAGDVGLGPVAAGGVGALALAEVVAVRPQGEADVVGEGESASGGKELGGEGGIGGAVVGDHETVVSARACPVLRCSGGR